MSIKKRRRGTAIVETEKGILVASVHKRLFLLPGGGAKGKESRMQAALRELQEETGFKSSSAEYLFNYTGKVHKSHGKGYFQDQHKVFLVKGNSDFIRPRKEVKHIAWYNPDSNIILSKTTKEIINKYYNWKNNKLSTIEGEGKIGVCNFHLCRKRIKLGQCQYCRLHFCEEHIKPKPASIPNFTDPTMRERILMHESERKDAHPCIPYMEYLDNLNIKEVSDTNNNNKCFYCNKSIITECKFCKNDICLDHVLPENHNCEGLKKFRARKLPLVEEFKDNPLYMEDYQELSKLSKSHKLDHDKNKDDIKSSYQRDDDYNDIGYDNDKKGYEEPEEDKYYQRAKKEISIDKPVKIVLVIAILITIGWAITKYGSDVASGVTRFVDDTFPTENTRIFTKPNPERKEDCMSAFNYLNEVRAGYGRQKLVWDDRLYNLAVTRSSDMYHRKYIDHVTPEGLCIKDMKQEFGIKSYENVAENVGGITYYNTGEVIGNCKETVDGWLESRGHRYNLLYEDHTKGAIGCYNYVCVFLGLNTVNYGLGDLPTCTTGAEGLAFWETAPKQLDEV